MVSSAEIIRELRAGCVFGAHADCDCINCVAADRIVVLGEAFVVSERLCSEFGRVLRSVRGLL